MHGPARDLSQDQRFGDQPKIIDLYEAEQAINDEVSIALLDDIADGRLALADILADTLLRELHQKLYGDLWTWAGRYRTRDLNIRVDPASIAVELRGSLDNIRYRWEHTDDWTARARHRGARRDRPLPWLRRREWAKYASAC